MKSVANFGQTFNKRFVGIGMMVYRRSEKEIIKTFLSVELSLIPGVPSEPAKNRTGCNEDVINIDF